MNPAVEVGQIWEYFSSSSAGETRLVIDVKGDHVICETGEGYTTSTDVPFLHKHAFLLVPAPKAEPKEPATDHSDTIQRLTELKKELEARASRTRSINPWGGYDIESLDEALNLNLNAKALEIAISVLKEQGA